MFKKVLIAEDIESTNISIRVTLADLEIVDTDYVFYCDHAFTRIKKALKSDNPYDLLVTDLSFIEDHNEQTILGGMELIRAAREIQPELKVIVFSAESRVATIEALFKELDINGYVRKARNDARDLKLAINSVSKGQRYTSIDLKRAIKERNSHEFTTFDTEIISQLYQGTLQKNIPQYLKQNNIKPSGLSSVEKRFNLMREVLGFSNNEQLVAYCKDMGII